MLFLVHWFVVCDNRSVDRLQWKSLFTLLTSVFCCHKYHNKFYEKTINIKNLLCKSALYCNNYRRNLPYRHHRHQLPLSCLQLLLPTASHPSLSSHDATPWMKSLHCHPCQILCKSINMNFILNSLLSFCVSSF